MILITDRISENSKIRDYKVNFVDNNRVVPSWKTLVNSDESKTVTLCVGLNRAGSHEIESQSQCFNIEINPCTNLPITIHPPSPIKRPIEYNYAVLTTQTDEVIIDVAPIPLKEELPENLDKTDLRIINIIKAMRFQISEILHHWPKGYVFKRMREGPICTKCIDPITKQKVISNCDLCLDTGIIGGYEYVPFETRVFTIKSSRIAQPEFVPNKKKQVSFFIEPIVEILRDDIILIPSIKKSFIVVSSSGNQTVWGYSISTRIDAFELPIDSIQHQKLFDRLSNLNG